MGLVKRIRSLFGPSEEEQRVKELSQELASLKLELKRERKRREAEERKAQQMKLALMEERRALSEEVDRLLQATKKLHEEKMRLTREQAKLHQAKAAPAPRQDALVRTVVKERTAASEEARKELYQKALRESQLIPEYLFDNYITGSSNQFAFDVALSVAQSPSQAYNPLFIYGDVGLGKTHLINAIGNYILNQNPTKRVLYVSSEEFTNNLIDALQSGNIEGFRRRHRDLDVLIIDDIQFIAKGESTQEEFFHTFNALYKARSQIIISSDRPPREIPTLEERLRSRFEGGLITSIQSPDYTMRRMILDARVKAEKVEVPEEVLDFIASEIHSNVRTLNGALNKLIVYSVQTGQPISREMAKIVLADLLPQDSMKTLCPICRFPMKEAEGRMQCPQCGHTM